MYITIIFLYMAQEIKNSQLQDFNIYRWYFWPIQKWDIIPMWGSVFSDNADSFLEVDESEVINWINLGAFEESYKQQKESIEWWMKSAKIDIPSRVFFAFLNVQSKVHKNLQVDHTQQDITSRNKIYHNKKQVKLSELIWNTACWERAALWTILLQELWIEAYYMGWYTFHEDIDDGAAHSWIVIPGEWETYIYDVARPINTSWTYIPNIYKIEWTFNKDTIWNSENSFVEATKVVWWTKRYFWVSAGRMSDEVLNIVSQILNN